MGKIPTAIMWIVRALFTLQLMHSCTGCVFPAEVTRNSTQPWVGKIHNIELHLGNVLVYFRENRMFVFEDQSYGEYPPEVKSLGVATYNRTCVTSVSSSKFLVMHDEDGGRPRYLCMEILVRSGAVFQLRSSGYSTHIDPLLCYNAEMKLDPWFYVSYEMLKHENTVCSFSGGFNMKVWSATGSHFGCNSMELPMRLESECLGGEGINFQFRYETCKEDLPMEVEQRAFCSANWIDGRYTYSVLRRFGRPELWCLRTPLVRSLNFTAVLFLDAMCGTDDKYNSTVNHIKLNLEEVQFHDICQDEYPGCSEKRCTEYTERSCLKSCGLCHTGEQMSTCKFPRPYRGDWLQRNYASHQQIRISSTKIFIQTMGSFKCVRSERSTEEVERKYAMVSTFSNGCRPRFTCVAFRRFGHSVLSFTLGQSMTWPFPPSIDVPETVCENSNFEPDPSPLNDLYRGHLDTFKTLVSKHEPRTHVNCKLRQAHKIRGMFNGSESCTGEMYEDCNDPSKIRMEIRDCGKKEQVKDFRCLATYAGRYWEQITIIQNIHDPMDARCMVFSEVRPEEMLIMAASECDKKSWDWQSSGERNGIGKFHFDLEDISCRIIPTDPPTTPKPPEEVTYRIVTNSKTVLMGTTRKTMPGHRAGSKALTGELTPPTESLAKEGNLQSDSGNVAVVGAPSRDNALSTGSNPYTARIMLTLAIAIVSSILLSLLRR